MSIQHVNIDDPNIHEPKGISTAASNTCYVANGAGTGTWKSCAGSHFGELIITSGITAQTIPAASAYATILPGTEWESGVSSGVTLNPTTGKITAAIAGVYQINFWINFTTAAIADGSEYRFKYGINDVRGVQTNTVHKTTNGVENLSTFASALVTLAVGDALDVCIAGDATASSTNITVTDAAFSMILMKAT